MKSYNKWKSCFKKYNEESKKNLKCFSSEYFRNWRKNDQIIIALYVCDAFKNVI